MRAATVRAPAVAGLFYPADATTLRQYVEEEVARALREAGEPGRPPKALVAPHAGYVYSGPIAASAWARFVPLRGTVERVALLGPAHTVAFAGIAAPSAETFATPLGLVRVDVTARDRLVAERRVDIEDRAHRDEHGLEVHLPFLQVVLGDVAVLPLVVGEVSPTAVAAVLDRVWGGPETVVVVSTDLSHYHDHETARELDRRTAAAIVARRPEAIGPHDACGAFPLRGLLAVARERGLAVDLLDLRTSADTAGDARRVVGYGAFALS